MAFIPFSLSSIGGLKILVDRISKFLLSTYVLLGSSNIHVILDEVANNDMHREGD